MALILLDTTAIVGFLDRDDALHEVTVTALKAAGAKSSFAASAVSYAEIMTGVALGQHQQDVVDGFFADLVRELLPVDRAVAARAGVLRGRRRSLRMPDALILASADLHEDVETVLCADGDWPKVQGLSCRVELLRP
ncbi:MAG TPA: PIN domain-containing protein [Solirubrobacteraceae bacterium]